MSNNKNSRRQSRLLKKALGRKNRRHGKPLCDENRPLFESLEQRMLLSAISITGGYDLHYDAAAGETNALTFWNSGGDYYVADPGATGGIIDVTNPAAVAAGWLWDAVNLWAYGPVGGITQVDIALDDMGDTTDIHTTGLTDIEAIALDAGGGAFSDTLTINGSGADNAISLAGTGATSASAQVDSGPALTITNLGTVGGSTFTINANGGDDVIQVTPGTLGAAQGITVNGGDPTSSDTLIVNGTVAADTIGFTPTGAAAGSVQVNALPLVTFTTTEQVVLNGQGGGDTLTVTTPAGANTIHYTVGEAPDAGGVGVDSLAAMRFENLGAAGTVAMADAAPARSDTLDYDGTAGNDAFAITAAGDVTLAGHLTVTSAGANAGLADVTLDGLEGEDTFAVANAHPYTTIRLNGGDPSASDVATLAGSAAAATVEMNSGTTVTTVAGAGLGTVALSGVEIVNLTTTGAVEIDGTSADDAFSVSPTGANTAGTTLAGLNTTVNTDNTGTFTIDGVSGGNDRLTVNGTSAGNTITVTPTTVTVTGLKAVAYTAIDGLGVNGQAGLDTVAYTGSAASEAYAYTAGVDGQPATLTAAGLPIGLTDIEAIALDAGGGAFSDTLTINGSGADNAISLAGTGATSA
ncbi:MAG: LEPR-XLL domain-containing protein, partial [Phycisphaerae bacterium]